MKSENIPNIFVSLGKLSGLVLFACFIAGCGSGLYPVQITVTVDGKPVENAAVELIGTKKEHNAAGKTNAEGVAVFKTGETDGVFAGTYTVTVNKWITVPTYTNEQILAMKKTGILIENEIKNLIPEKYTKAGTSDCQIEAGYWKKNQYTCDW
ncbi:hypothetical protein FACS189419_02880 [Planctomycetales bacterium]|nr:hypothetical protein FACS189419_02880 [Planctomycetales bacterium]